MTDKNRLNETEYIDGEVIDDGPQLGLARTGDNLPAINAIAAHWAELSTRDGKRKHDLVRDKVKALAGDTDPLGFFAYTGKGLAEVGADDVARWQHYLTDYGLAASTIYARVSRVSAFYRWLMKHGRATHNPTTEARPKAPKPYQNPKAQALDDGDVKALLAHVKARADGGNLPALRDYALLVMFFNTGKRRAEVINLTAGDVKVNGMLKIRTREKGGNYRTTRINNPATLEALTAYLSATGRDLASMKPSDPLWLRHDRAASGTEAVTSHGFVKQLKRYAKAAGLGDIHLHQTRHTVARKLAEQYHDVGIVQSQLGHADRRTTEVYTGRLTEQADYVSEVSGDWGF